jgi:hypothetical protein
MDIDKPSGGIGQALGPVSWPVYPVVADTCPLDKYTYIPLVIMVVVDDHWLVGREVLLVPPSSSLLPAVKHGFTETLLRYME